MGALVAQWPAMEFKIMIPKHLIPTFESVGSALNFPPEILAGIAWRESCFGATLDHNGYGDHGNGYGIMQVDRRSHMLVGKPDSIEHVTQGAHILNDMRNAISKKHPDWSKADQLSGSIAAYNVGPDNIRTVDHMDSGTTENNYSADVLNKARMLKEYFVV